MSPKQPRNLFQAVRLGFDLEIRDIEEQMTSTLRGFVPFQRPFEYIDITMPDIVRVALEALEGHSKSILR